MQFTTAFIAALFATIGMAQLSAYPACAQTCLQAGKTSCAQTDTACLCGDANFQSGVSSCVMSSCSLADQLASRNAQSGACGN